MELTDHLPADLRAAALAADRYGPGMSATVGATYRAAADRIEALQAERDALRAIVQRQAAGWTGTENGTWKSVAWGPPLYDVAMTAAELAAWRDATGGPTT